MTKTNCSLWGRSIMTPKKELNEHPLMLHLAYFAQVGRMQVTHISSGSRCHTFSQS